MKNIWNEIPKWVRVWGFAVLAVIVLWHIAYPRDSIRYKITINIETPEGLKTGSAVREVTVKQFPQLTPEMQPMQSLKGEAAVVDLGTRGVLFAVMGTDDFWTYFYAFAPEGKGGGEAIGRFGMKPYKAQPHEVRPLSVRFHPTMVMFKDMNDPKSITLAYHATPYEVRDKNDNKEIKYKVEDNLEKLFGKGVRLQSITMERTEEPIVWIVKNYISWLPDYYSKLLDGRNIHTIDAENRLANSLGSGSFSTNR